MKLYWLDVSKSPFWPDGGFGAAFGYGITAHDEADAVALLEDHFTDRGSPFHKELVTSIRSVNDLAEIEQNHVRPNMGNHLRRGIWYPQGLNADRHGW